MNIHQSTHQAPNLKGLKVLAMLPSSTEERGDYLLRLLLTMKERWNWNISVLCPEADGEAFRGLVEPQGRIYATVDYRGAAEWESDPEAVARVDGLLREAELVSGVPIGQWVLACQGNIGGAFPLPYLKQKNSSTVTRVIADNTEPFRILRRLFAFGEDVVEQAQPDLVIAYEWAKPWRSNIWMAATRRKIPSIVIRRSKLNADHYFWTTDRTFFNIDAHQLAERKRQAGAQVSERAREKIKSFRERPQTVKYIREKWEMLSGKSWLRWHRDWARASLKSAARKALGRGKPGKSSIMPMIEHNRRLMQARRDQAFFTSYDEAELSSMKYIYFPMHKETDLPLVFQTPRWHDQTNTIHVLAAALPSGYKLLCREHRFNVGMRPERYYQYLASLPNVVLIDPFGDQFSYIRNASLVVTENGSSGWEALMYCRPTITLSRTVYDGAGLARKIVNPDAIGAEVLKAISEPLPDQDEYESRLGWMMDAEIETTFSMQLDRAGDGADRLQKMLPDILWEPTAPAQGPI